MGIIFFASRKKLLLKVLKNGLLILSTTEKTKTQKLERNTLPREREMCERAKSERERKREGAGEGERERSLGLTRRLISTTSNGFSQNTLLEKLLLQVL